MKSLMQLLQCVLTDCGTRCRTSTTLDWKTIQGRFENEGVSFLGITLPAFCQEFERALDDGRVSHVMFRSFSRHEGLPRFLGGFLGQVFDRRSGLLLDEPSIEAIRSIRQIALMCKKILLPCSKQREEAAYAGFAKCENEVQEWVNRDNSRLYDEFDSAAHILWSRVLSSIDLAVFEGRHRPKHGPGATADRLFGNEKYNLRIWHQRLEDYFPSAEFIIPNVGFYEELEHVDFVEPGQELPVRVITVPKTLKGPRIIAVEPTCMQYAQQSLLELLVFELERDDLLRDSIGFTDQTPNQRMAQAGSASGRLATIDLSEASDRVPWPLVRNLLKNFPSLAGAVDSCRSRVADVPGHGLIPLSKYASMGSALCFPIEAMVFLTIVLVGIARELNKPLTPGLVYKLLESVRVYGDDIIVPVEYVQSVMNALSDFNLKVNDRKSFWTGRFRESCGKDYYLGEDVTVVYFRRVLPSSRRDVSEMISAVSLRNQLYLAGYWTAAGYLDTFLERLIPFPNVSETSPALGRFSYLGFSQDRICEHLHRPLVKACVVVPKPRSSKLDGPGALLKFFLKRGSDPFFDAKHLERYGRPESVDIKIRWASPI